MNALTKTEADTNVVALVEPPLSDSLLNFVAMAVRDPSVDVTKLEALLRMQREIVAADGRVQFYRALGEFAREVPQIPKLAKTDKYKHARREDMDDIIRPLLTKHGLVLSFRPVSSSLEAITVEGELVHTATGHAKTAQFTLPPDFGPGRNNLQAFGSSKAYAERYLTEMLCGLVRCDEDNDGNRRAANDDGRITEGQVEELHDLMTRGRIREGTVLEKMAPGLRSISQLPAKDYPRIKNALLSRLTVLDEREAFAARTQNRDARS
jgi:hypothetical protein